MAVTYWVNLGLQLRVFNITKVPTRCFVLGVPSNALLRSAVRSSQKSLSPLSRVSFSKQIGIQKNIPKDVLVYSHSNHNFYKMLSYFGIFQMAMWGYLSLFSIQQLKMIPPAVKDSDQLSWWKRLIYKEGQYKNAISIISFVVGVSVLFITMVYPRRAIQRLWILKGGEDVKITTYGWMGQVQTFRKPLEHIDCIESRTGRGNHVPLKIKHKNFYFLVDKQGTFHNTDLFDFVIGLKRNLR